MSEVMLASLFTFLGVVLTKGVDHARDRRASESSRHVAELDASGEWERALLLDQASFRADLLAQLRGVREELDGHDEKCDAKIERALARSEAECAARLQASIAQLRAEIGQRIDEISEPITRDIL